MVSGNRKVQVALGLCSRTKNTPHTTRTGRVSILLVHIELALKLVDSILASGLGLLARMDAWSQYMLNPSL